MGQLLINIRPRNMINTIISQDQSVPVPREDIRVIIVDNVNEPFSESEHLPWRVNGCKVKVAMNQVARNEQPARPQITMVNTDNTESRRCCCERSLLWFSDWM